MIGPALENPRKNTVVKKQKKMDSAYPQSDGVRSESARKSSGSVKISNLIIYALIKLAEFFVLLFQMGAGTEYGKKLLAL